MNISRRRFVRASGALAGSSLFFPSIIRAQTLGHEKLKVAIIGVGGRGRVHVSGLNSQEIVAFCDVDDSKASNTYEKYPNVPRFKDYRVMLDKIGKEIDAISIATPDHMHYPMALWALAHGKHILVEKPLVRTVEEAMRLKAAAKEAGVITQMGNQGHANDGIRVIEEWINAGLIGEVQEVYHWTDRPIWPQGMANWNAEEPVPLTLDWDLWLGVAPQRQFREGLVPFSWRGYRDFGSGAIGDIACHCMDAPYTALNLGFPTSLVASSTGMTDIAFPKQSQITFDFERPGQSKPLKVYWMDGGLKPRHVPFVPDEVIHGNDGSDGNREKKPVHNGTFIVGTKGTIMADMYCGRPLIYPYDYYRELRMDDVLPEKTLPRVKGGHFMEWVNGIKEGTQPGANIVDYAADFSATALLGTVALACDGSLAFDSKTKKFLGNEQANGLLKSQYEYRKEFLPL